MFAVTIPRAFVGRLLAFLIGLALLLGGMLLPPRLNHAPAPAVWLGGALVGIATLADVVKRVGGPVPVETRDPQDIEPSAREAHHRATARAPEEGDAVEEDEDAVALARLYVADRVLRDLLAEKPTGPVAGCEFRLYVFDAERNRLLPMLEPEADPTSEGWAVGQGATGQAFQQAEYVAVEGPACSDGTYGLTPEQQEKYKDLQAVAAMPVLNAAGSVIAVLSASTTRSDTGLLTDEGFNGHLLLAAAVARVLIDLLKWFYDE